MEAVIFSEDALVAGDRLWADAVAHLARRLGRVKPLDPDQVPRERRAALAMLEAWAGDEVSTWRAELARYHEEHMPVYVRPDPDLNAVLRHLQLRGLRLGAWSPGPPEVGIVITHFLGLTRRLDAQRVDPADTAPVALAGELGILPERVLVVSAGAHSLAEAKLAGMPTAAALWTGRPREALLDALPTYLAETPAELVQLALS